MPDDIVKAIQSNTRPVFDPPTKPDRTRRHVSTRIIISTRMSLRWQNSHGRKIRNVSIRRRTSTVVWQQRARRIKSLLFFALCLLRFTVCVICCIYSTVEAYVLAVVLAKTRNHVFKTWQGKRIVPLFPFWQIISHPKQ